MTYLWIQWLAFRVAGSFFLYHRNIFFPSSSGPPSGAHQTEIRFQTYANELAFLLVKVDVRFYWKLFLDASSKTKIIPKPTVAKMIGVFWWSHSGIPSGDWKYILYTMLVFFHVRSYQTLHSLSQTVRAVLKYSNFMPKNL